MFLPRLRAILLAGAVLLWIGVVVAGMHRLTEYAYLPGPEGRPEDRWPAESQIVASSKLPTLVMFAHPRCPCTRASINELAVMMAQCDGKLSARVVFFQPEGTDPSWARTDLWSAASLIPTVQVVADQGGTEFRRFGAMTSGQVMVYDIAGQLAFHGGITAARGHAGDNLGRASVVGLVGDLQVTESGSACRPKTPVFGCPLSE